MSVARAATATRAQALQVLAASRAVADLLVPFGERVSDGRMVRPSEVANGLACGCVCTKCRRHLVAKQGAIVQAHFAHEADTECERPGESAVHAMAKQIISDRRAVHLPLICANGYAWCDVRSRWSAVNFERVTLEVTLPGMRPDIVGHRADGDVLIEVAVSHFCDPAKADLIRAHGLPAIEIDLRHLRHDDGATGALLTVLATAPRRWIYHREVERLAAEAAAVEQQRLAQAEERQLQEQERQRHRWELARQAQEERWRVERLRQEEIRIRWEAERPQREAAQAAIAEQHRQAAARVSGLMQAWEIAKTLPEDAAPHYYSIPQRDREAAASLIGLGDVLDLARGVDAGAVGRPPFRLGWRIAWFLSALKTEEFEIVGMLRRLRSQGYIHSGLGGFISSDDAWNVRESAADFTTPFQVMLDSLIEDPWPFEKIGDRRWAVYAHARQEFADCLRNPLQRSVDRLGDAPPERPAALLRKPISLDPNDFPLQGAHCAYCDGEEFWTDGVAGVFCARCQPSNHLRQPAPATINRIRAQLDAQYGPVELDARGPLH
jgi:hypothetical protein